ncbi:MAG: hypothetical protein GTO18_15265 [Anaerolineales bacterium]|nr:hypothetical protein [Anaerolineales bacterium]
MSQCWFCEKNPADPKLAFKVKFHDGGSMVKSVGREVTYEYKWTEVAVPKCKECDSKMATAWRRNFLAGAAFILPIVGGFVLISIYPELGTAYKVAFPCIGAVIGLILGLAIAMKFGGVEEGIKPSESVLEYPGVVQMISSPFWHIEDAWKSQLEKSQS